MEARAEGWDFGSGIAPLLESLAGQGRHLIRLAVRDRLRIRVLDVGEVDWIGIEDEQTVVHVGSASYAVRRTLADLEARLDPARFFRGHRAVIGRPRARVL